MIEPIGGSIARELGRFGPPGGLEPIVEAWPTAVGAEIARNAWPARLARDGTLHVHTQDSIWAFELTSRADEIRVRLGELAPPRLAFAAGPLPEAGKPDVERSQAEAPHATQRQRAQADAIAEHIRDAELREIVARTIAASLARERC